MLPRQPLEYFNTMEKQFTTKKRSIPVPQEIADRGLTRSATVALIKLGRGIVKRGPGENSLARDWALHRRREIALEERHGRPRPEVS